MTEVTVLSAELRPLPCACSTHSWTLPAQLYCDFTVGERGDSLTFHWDRAGWTPCVADPKTFSALHNLALALGLDIPTFEEWMRVAAIVADQLNQQPLAYWRASYQKAVAAELATKETMLLDLRERVAGFEKEILLERCRAAVAGWANPAKASLGNRLIAGGWPGSPTELEAAIEAVLNQRRGSDPPEDTSATCPTP